MPLPNNLNVGLPDGNILTILSGDSVVIDLGANALVVPHSGADLVYYEYEFPAGSGSIMLDWVIIEISVDGVNWIKVFDWGDGDNTNNGSLGSSYPEYDNQTIPWFNLYGPSLYRTGIAIDVDIHAPSAIYGYIRITAPGGDTDNGAQIDAIEILP